MSVYDVTPARALVERHDSVRYPYECEFGDAVLRIDKGVFCPTLTKTSPVLLDSIDFRAGERVLDAFSGSGAFGIVAALHGAHVVTIDLSPRAVACAADNARRNGVRDRMDVRRGDLTAPAGINGLSDDDVFDLVIANPPLLPGRADDLFGRALFDIDLRATRGFIDALPAHLAPTGRSYLLTSDVLERIGMCVASLCASQALSATLVRVQDVGYEKYRVHKITWPVPC
jgi:methylase of polypeptide subunit release factors